jgi:hypothetical protein
VSALTPGRSATRAKDKPWAYRLSLVDVSLGKPLPARRYALALGGIAYRPALDHEPLGKLVDRRTCLVGSNQVCDLLALEPPGGAWCRGGLPLYGRCVRPRQCGDKVLEGLELGLCVPRGSPVARSRGSRSSAVVYRSSAAFSTRRVPFSRSPGERPSGLRPAGVRGWAGDGWQDRRDGRRGSMAPAGGHRARRMHTRGQRLRPWAASRCRISRRPGVSSLSSSRWKPHRT